MNFTERLQHPSPILIDGAMGTELFKKAPGNPGPLELFNATEPRMVESVHRNYLDAGAEIIESNTFGGSALKLAEYGLGDRCEELNERGAALASETAHARGAFVAGSVGPTGTLVEPVGSVPAEEVYESFLRQCRGLARGGADLIIIETMNDLQEAKLAILAARDAANLPVLCSITFEATGKTITGSDMVTALASAAAFGADIIGANCSMGPQGLLDIYRNSIGDLREIGRPLSAWANAGMPVYSEEGISYRMSPQEFAQQSMGFLSLGVRLVGGCCGTTPDHIRELRDRMKNVESPAPKPRRLRHYITGRSSRLDPDAHRGLIIIGERLNPSARKAFAQDLREGKQQYLMTESKKQEGEGAHLLDINVGVPGLDETALIRDAVAALSRSVSLPLMIDSDNAAVVEKALLAYPGVPVVNSVNGKRKSIDMLLPVIRRFGSYVVALCLDDTGIHREADLRISIGEALLEELRSAGIPPQRVFIDPLMLAESAEPGSAMETLRVIEHFFRKGIKTSIGLSNISFGLPERRHINSAFLKLAVQRGLTAAICNPAVAGSAPAPLVQGSEPRFSDEERMAVDFLAGRDPGAKRYIERFQKSEPQKKSREADRAAQSPLRTIYGMVVDGNIDEIEDSVRNTLESEAPETIMNDGLLGALERVGELYSTGEYFLPQMIASASAMKRGFSVLKPLLSTKATHRLGRVVICTVRGDVHDIGKNIVAMMLENHGFEVFDLGKDVPAEEIVAKTKETGAGLVCLSSLLTTTMGEMKTVRDLLQKENLSAQLLVGGAVVTGEFAAGIGALYGKDAVEGVAAAKKALGAR
ncbi:MAG: homocysteine S-methyltransferase family protein [Spirochaetes bacterium]|nr:homocysteine S-methyltransferase family protein [Spirochaetota bacterium]